MWYFQVQIVSLTRLCLAPTPDICCCCHGSVHEVAAYLEYAAHVPAIHVLGCIHPHSSNPQLH